MAGCHESHDSITGMELAAISGLEGLGQVGDGPRLKFAADGNIIESYLAAAAILVDCFLQLERERLVDRRSQSWIIS